MDNRWYFRDFYIPEYMRQGLIDYIEKRVPPGGFLERVICNDLMGALGAADALNIGNLPAYGNFLYNYAPCSCHGSVEKYRQWIKGE